MPQVKTDGLGFQIMDPHELPQIHTANSEFKPFVEQVDAQVSMDLDTHSEPSSSDPLYDFLEKRKKQRSKYMGTYSKKAVALNAYQRQLDADAQHGGILLNSRR